VDLASNRPEAPHQAPAHDVVTSDYLKELRADIRRAFRLQTYSILAAMANQTIMLLAIIKAVR
jgi:hypothetical protein